MSEHAHLSRQRTAHALRHFVFCGSLWAVYGPNATAAGAIFSGFALFIGLSEAQIAFLVSLSALAGVSQLVTFYLSRRVVHKRRFMLLLGHFEITAASCVLLMALVDERFRFGGVAALLVTAYLLGHTVSPLFSSWLSNVVPADVRATYIGRRMFIITVTSMVYLYAASLWIDWAPGLAGFWPVFAVGWLAGLAGYWILGLTPIPPLDPADTGGFARSLLEPLRDRRFTVLALFMCSWTVAMSLSGTFFGVYMIREQYLGLTYGRIAVYTNITLLCMVVGYLGFGGIAQRYGSRPVAQLLIVPALVVPLLWMFTTRETYVWLIPIACLLNGLAISGLSVALGSLLYKIVPAGVENSSYFANWAGMSAIAAALGPFVGGALRHSLPEQMPVLGLEMASLQVIFGLSACLYVPPLVLAAFIVEAEATSPRHLLGQFRGNLLSFAWNAAMFRVARGDERRAEAVRALGRSRTPLAVDPLLRALGHVSHEVRSEAARGLGDGHFAEAVDPLLEALEDRDSDIRPEAAEALGKIGHSAAAEPLLRALRDDDPRVRASAALALGEIGGEAAAAALMEALQGPFDRALFPTLVEAATHRPDLRVVAPIMQGLARVRQPVVRMQVLNGVCRVLGEKNHFYRLATADTLQRAGLGEPMMERIVRLLGRAAAMEPHERRLLRGLARDAARALEGDDLDAFAGHCGEIARAVLEPSDTPPVARHAAMTIIMYLDSAPPEVLASEGVVLLIIALTALGRSLAGQHPQDRAR